jgi:hypothetical protein
MSSPLRLIRWWLGKLVPGLLVSGLALAAGAGWLDWHDRVDFPSWREEQLQALGTERAQVLGGLDDVRARLGRIQGQIPLEQERVRQADKIIGELSHLASTWDRLVGNPEQQKANHEQLTHVTQLRADAAERVAALQQESRQTSWERDGLEITRASVDARLRAVETDRSVAAHYLGLAWRRMRVGLVGVLTLYSLGWVLFYFRRRPI